MERKETVGKKPPPITQTSEFGQAIKTYKEVLQSCKVPSEDIQKQIIRLQESTVPRKRILGFIDIAQKLQTTSPRKIDQK